jgi:hypothetical protein
MFMVQKSQEFVTTEMAKETIRFQLVALPIHYAKH